MVTKIRKWGNSLGVRLPKSALQEAEVSEGTPVDVKVRNGSIVLVAVKRPRYRLSDLLAGIRPGARHEEAGFGEPQGGELL